KEIIQLKVNSERKLSEQLAEKDTLLTQMKAKLENSETEKKLLVTEAIQKIAKERDDLANNLKLKETERQLLEKSLSEKHSAELKAKDDIIKHKDDEIA